MTRDLFIIAIFAIIGIGMVIAGIGNMRSADNPEDGSTKKPSKTTVSGWMLGSSEGMDPRRAGRARITIGVICVIAALLYAGVKFLDN
ncbi:hypothetical protein ACFLVR_03780 [Chloroflexota bacterium]